MPTIDVDLDTSDLEEELSTLSEEVRDLRQAIAELTDLLVEVAQEKQKLPYGLGVPGPDEDRNKWNEAALSEAIERNLNVTFMYVKPLSRFDRFSSSEDRRVRRVTPRSIEGGMGDYAVLEAFDLDASAPRNFRLDRIEGFVSVLTD